MCRPDLGIHCAVSGLSLLRSRPRKETLEMDGNYPLAAFNRRYGRHVERSLLVLSLVIPVVLFVAYQADLTLPMAFRACMAALVVTHLVRIVALRKQRFEMGVKEIVAISLTFPLALFLVWGAAFAAGAEDHALAYKAMLVCLWMVSLLSAWWDFLLISIVDTVRSR